MPHCGAPASHVACGVVRALVWIGLALAAVAAVAVLRRPLLGAVGRFLVVEDPVQPADAIVVLSGSVPDRVMEAVDLYQEGVAPRIVLTRAPEFPGLSTLRARGGRLLDHHEQNRSVAEQLGVPPAAVSLVPTIAASTLAEAREIVRYLGEERLRTVLVVTSKLHARRARMTLRQLAGDGVRIVVRPSRYDPFAPDDWWRHRAWTRRLVIEYLKLLNYLLIDRWCMGAVPTEARNE